MKILDEWEDVEAAVKEIQQQQAGERFTMRDHQWPGFYRDTLAEQDTEEDDAFDSRRAGLIEHYVYCKANRVR